MSGRMANIGLIGLAVMGENLAMNMESKGFRVAVYNRTPERMRRFMEGRAKARAKTFLGCETLAELCEAVERPRRIMLMIKAGKPVDDMIEQLLPYMERRRRDH